MSNDKSQSLSEVWSDRFDDRDDEDLACQVWAHRLTLRDRAMAQPIKETILPEDASPVHDLPEPASDKPTVSTLDSPTSSSLIADARPGRFPEQGN